MLTHPHLDTLKRRAGLYQVPGSATHLDLA